MGKYAPRPALPRPPAVTRPPARASRRPARTTPCSGRQPTLSRPRWTATTASYSTVKPFTPTRKSPATNPLACTAAALLTPPTPLATASPRTSAGPSGPASVSSSSLPCCLCGRGSRTSAMTVSSTARSSNMLALSASLLALSVALLPSPTLQWPSVTATLLAVATVAPSTTHLRRLGPHHTSPALG